MATPEDPQRCYDPGYAAGATLRRAHTVHSEPLCEQGLAMRLEIWTAHHFIRAADTGAQHRHVCREYFRRGFRDGYWGRAGRREVALGLVA